MFGYYASRATSRRLLGPWSSQRILHRSSCISRMPFLGQRCPGVRGYTTREKARALFRAHPFSMSLASFFILFGLGGLVWTGYYYKTYIIGGFKRYPEPVAEKLRKALYYSNYRPSPTEAVQNYWDALKVAAEIGMDPLSDEVLGIQIQLAAFLEQIEQHSKAIDVLEHVLRQCKAWIDQHQQLKPQEISPEDDQEPTQTRRSRLLVKAVSTAVKLGELYDNESVKNRQAVEDRLTWAVETVLKEEQKRQQQRQVDEQRGIPQDQADEGKPDADIWLTPEQISATFEALAHHYEEREMYHLAAPLFLEALSLVPSSDFQAFVLMNNLSACFAQQSTMVRGGDEQAAATREQLLRSAEAWLKKASELLGRIGNIAVGDPRAEAVLALNYNQARIAELGGALDDATRLYSSAAKLAWDIGSNDLCKKLREDIVRLQKARPSPVRESFEDRKKKNGPP